MNISLNFVLIIISTTVIVIFIFIIVMIQILFKRERSGNLNIITKIGICSGDMLIQLQRKYSDWKLNLRSFKSIDLFIENKISIYGIEALLRDEELIFSIGSFIGEVLRCQKGFKWKINENEISMQKGAIVIYPFHKVRNRIEKGTSESIYEFGKQF